MTHLETWRHREQQEMSHPSLLWKLAMTHRHIHVKLLLPLDIFVKKHYVIPSDNIHQDSAR